MLYRVRQFNLKIRKLKFNCISLLDFLIGIVLISVIIGNADRTRYITCKNGKYNLHQQSLFR